MPAVASVGMVVVMLERALVIVPVLLVLACGGEIKEAVGPVGDESTGGDVDESESESESSSSSGTDSETGSSESEASEESEESEGTDESDSGVDPDECRVQADCVVGNCLSGACVQVRSCKQLDELDTDEQLASGVYQLDSDGVGPAAPYEAYCELELMGGGWTLVLKSNGGLGTFHWTSPEWGSTAAYQPEFPDLDRNEAKLASYWQVEFGELLIGMEQPVGVDPEPLALTWLVVPIVGNSLHALITPGVHVPTTLGRDAWKSLITGSSLQVNCNREGINAFGPNNSTDHRVRIGIIGNDQNECNSPNSRLGIGGQGNKCGAMDLPTGNFAGCDADNGDQDLIAFGVVLVR